MFKWSILERTYVIILSDLNNQYDKISYLFILFESPWLWINEVFLNKEFIYTLGCILHSRLSAEGKWYGKYNTAIKEMNLLFKIKFIQMAYLFGWQFILFYVCDTYFKFSCEYVHRFLNLNAS